jgi:hypothetical protein
MTNGKLGIDNRGTYNIIMLNAERFAPCAHHVRIIVGNDNDLVDSLLFELLEVCDEARNMLFGASAGESTWDGNKNDLLISKF